ncbi:MAG: hypothetical protein ABIH23_05635 [bacterium]
MISLGRRDGLLLLLLSGCVLLGAVAAGPAEFTPLPAWLYIPILLLFAVSADARKRANPANPLVAYFPVLFAGVLTVFCLLTQMPVLLWAFIIPNRFPLLARAAWAVLVPVLLHPAVETMFYDTLWKGVCELGRRGYWTTKIWITIPVLLLFLWPFHSQNLSPDGYDWLVHSIHPGHWIRYLREPFGTMTFRGVTLMGIWVGGLAPMLSIGLTTYLCGFASVALLWGCLGRVCEEKEERFLWLLAALASCGFTQLFIGNIEIYAILMVAFTLFLLTALRYLDDAGEPIWVGFAFAILFVTHLSAGWWIPAFLLLPVIRNRGMNTRKRNGLNDTIDLAESSALPVLLFVLWLLWYGYGADPDRMWDHFWGPQVMQVGADGAMFRTVSEMVSSPIILTMVNEYFYLSPIVCGLLLFMVCRLCLPRLNRDVSFFGLLAGPYLLYSVVWRPDRKFPLDWDIFSGLTVPALLFLLVCLRQAIEDGETRARIIRPLVTFSASLAILQTLYNHFLRISSWPLPN